MSLPIANGNDSVSNASIPSQRPRGREPITGAALEQLRAELLTEKLPDSPVRRQAAQACLDEFLTRGDCSPKALQRAKLKYSKKFALERVLRNSELLAVLPAEIGKTHPARLALTTNPVRDLSGVSVLAIMTKPMGCVGRCIYCPGGVQSPKSYTGFEPSARRAAQNDYDSARQIRARLAQLRATGHEPTKCEVVMMGSTFAWMPREYRAEFIKGVFDGLNGFGSATLEAAKTANETAAARCVGLVAETRPDWCSPAHVRDFLDYGVTRVELGVQTLSDAVLQKVDRGHDVAAVRDASATLRQAFYKIGYHVMPGLFATPEEDVATFDALFADDGFKPDMLKIYPALVMPDTPLYERWRRGEYVPYDAETAARVIARAQRFVPPYCRVMRVERDIPTNLVADGVMKSNLRQLVDAEMKRNGWRCACIRCREVGFRLREGAAVDFANAKLNRLDYEASGGREVFLSFDDEKSDALFGFIRLRAPSHPRVVEELSDATAGIRELHVYGDQVSIGEPARREGAVQHQGFGKRLLENAEKIAREEFDADHLAVLAGVGTREYYRQNGYALRGAYMQKELA